MESQVCESPSHVINGISLAAGRDMILRPGQLKSLLNFDVVGLIESTRFQR